MLEVLTMHIIDHHLKLLMISLTHGVWVLNVKRNYLTNKEKKKLHIHKRLSSARNHRVTHISKSSCPPWTSPYPCFEINEIVLFVICLATPIGFSVSELCQQGNLFSIFCSMSGEAFALNVCLCFLLSSPNWKCCQKIELDLFSFISRTRLTKEIYEEGTNDYWKKPTILLIYIFFLYPFF